MKERKPLWTAFEPGVPEFDPVGGKIFINSRYQVSIRGIFRVDPFGRFVELSIKRRDKEAILDWRDMQKIKNDLVGPEATMIQIFPPEKHLVDTSNQYYFYAFLDYELPFGFKERLVSEATGQKLFEGIPYCNQNKQRPFEAHQIPESFEADRLEYERQCKQAQDMGWPPKLKRDV